LQEEGEERRREKNRFVDRGGGKGHFTERENLETMVASGRGKMNSTTR